MQTAERSSRTTWYSNNTVEHGKDSDRKRKGTNEKERKDIQGGKGREAERERKAHLKQLGKIGGKNHLARSDERIVLV